MFYNILKYKSAIFCTFKNENDSTNVSKIVDLSLKKILWKKEKLFLF